MALEREGCGCSKNRQAVSTIHYSIKDRIEDRSGSAGSMQPRKMN